MQKKRIYEIGGEPVGKKLYIQLTCWYAPSYGFGGPVRLMEDYAKWCIEAGIKVKILTGNVHHDYTRLPLNTSHPLKSFIYRFPVLGTSLAKRALFLLSPRFFYAVFKSVFTHEGTVYIHTFEYRGLVPLGVVIIKKLFAQKVVFVHSAFGTLHYKKSRIRELYDRIFLTDQIRALDISLAQNNHEKAVYRDLLSSCDSKGVVHLVPLHLDISAKVGDCNYYKKISVDLRKRHELSQDNTIMLFLGRFHPEKGLYRVVDLLKSVSISGIDAVLLLVGRDYGFQHKIEYYISTLGLTSRVHIITDVTAERFDYYRIADIFVGFPTIYEETMLSAVEALSCGTPVLLSREADMPFVEEENAGFVIDFDIDLAKKRLMTIIEKQKFYEANALRVANTYYSPSTIKEIFLNSLFFKKS